MSTESHLANRGRESRPPQLRGTDLRGTDRLPAPPRQRRPALAALAVLLIVGGAALAGLLAVRMDARVPVVVAARDIPVGTQLTRGDLSTALIASDGIATIPGSSINELVGQFTNRALSRQQLLDVTLVDRQGFLRVGMVAAGVPMVPGRVPAQGLQVGDVVQILRVPKDGASPGDAKGSVLSPRAIISQTTLQSGESSLTGADQGITMQDGNQAATVLVTAAEAGGVARAAAANEISLVLLERGTLKATN